MARVARVIHEHLSRPRTERKVDPGRRRKDILGVYIYIYAPRVSGLMTETI